MFRCKIFTSSTNDKKRKKRKSRNSFKIENGGNVDCLRLQGKEGISPSEKASIGAGNHLQWNSYHNTSAIWKVDAQFSSCLSMLCSQWQVGTS